MKRSSRPDNSAAEAARLGGQLRDARLALGLTLEDLAAALRIRLAYLVAIEDGRLKDLPAPAYVLGFVRGYARALGLDADDTARQYREAAAGGSRKPELVFPEPVPERGIPAGAVMLAGAVLVIGAYAAWYQWSGSEVRTVDAVPPMPARLEQLTAREGGAPALAFIPPPPGDEAPGRDVTPVTVPNALPAGLRPPPGPSSASAATAPSPPTPADAPPAPLAVAVQTPQPEEPRIQLRAKAETWINLRDRVASQVLVSRVLKPGETLPVPPRPGLVVTTGNAPGLEILVDGEPTPPLPGSPIVRRDIPLEAERLKAGNFSSMASAEAAPARAARSAVRPAEPSLAQ